MLSVFTKKLYVHVLLIYRETHEITSTMLSYEQFESEMTFPTIVLNETRIENHPVAFF